MLRNKAAGIQGNEIGLAATWWDYNDDGRPDLYVSNDYKGTDRLWRNEGGGTFTDVTREALPHMAWASMGADVADVNNDGRLDLMTTDMAGSSHERHMLVNGDLDDERWFLRLADPPQYRRNCIYLNTGTTNTIEVACLAGLAATDWTWSPKFADFDNDGWIDLFVSNGMSRDFMNSDLLRELKGRGHAAWRQAPVLREANFAFRNTGDVDFQNVAKEWGLDLVSASFGAAVADLDRDGDMDLVVTSFDQPLAVYRNNSTSGKRILIRLIGVASNASGVGARITAETSAGIQTRAITLTSGFMSANEPLAHFGLGEDELITTMRIDWPSGHRQTLTNLSAGYFYTIIEPSSPAKSVGKSEARPILFKRLRGTTAIRHREESNQDSRWPPLLPWVHSRWGPGLAFGDVNKDGRNDLFLGGGAGHPAVLCLKSAEGNFSPARVPALEEDKASNDTGVLFLDIDGDDDLDLFVVSGGSEALPGETSLRDRIYLNDGGGNFTKAPADTLPDLRESGTVATAADFDRDGDLDIFVGTYDALVGYPQNGRSRLLQNHRGRFKDVSETCGLAAADLRFATGALWSDVNRDGWIDLLVTQHWGPIRLFINERGILKDCTREAGLAEHSGLWNGIAGADLNADGLIDYVVTNWGLNNPRQLSPGTSIIAYIGDLSGSGQQNFVSAYYRGETLDPIASRDEMIAAFPWLAERFPTFGSYASASLFSLFAPEALAKVARHEANTFTSSILFNDGSGRFTLRALPRLAQAAPAFGVVLSDFDADGTPDIFIGQNFSHTHPEIGRLTAGLGLLLAGRGDGHFEPIWPEKSGIRIPHDARSVVASDVNNDQWPDLVVGLNDGEAVVLQNAGSPKRRVLELRLNGQRSNRAAAGARVKIEMEDGSSQVAEVYAGSGYLSQSEPTVTFGLAEADTVRRIHVFWPDGQESAHMVETNRNVVLLHAPAP